MLPSSFVLTHINVSPDLLSGDVSWSLKTVLRSSTVVRYS